MTSALAGKSGRSERGFAHLGLCYDNAVSYLAGVVPFIEQALAEGTPVMVAVPGDKLGLIRRQLGAAAAKAQLADMTVAGRNPGWILPGVLLEFADRHAGGPVAMVGEPIWPDRSDTEYPACVVHEALINAAFAGRDGAVLCPYDATNLKPAVLQDALQTHPEMLENGQRWPSELYTEPQVTVAEFRTALPPPPAGSVSVTYRRPDDLAGLRRFVMEKAQAAGFDQHRAADVAVAVNELATNTLDHTAGGGELTVWTDRRAFVCQVEDTGHLTDLLAGYVPPSPTERRGRGLILANRVSDLVRMHTQPGKTTFRAHFYR